MSNRRSSTGDQVSQGAFPWQLILSHPRTGAQSSQGAGPSLVARVPSQPYPLSCPWCWRITWDWVMCPVFKKKMNSDLVFLYRYTWCWLPIIGKGSKRHSTCPGPSWQEQYLVIWSLSKSLANPTLSFSRLLQGHQWLLALLSTHWRDETHCV